MAGIAGGGFIPPFYFYFFLIYLRNLKTGLDLMEWEQLAFSNPAMTIFPSEKAIRPG